MLTVPVRTTVTRTNDDPGVMHTVTSAGIFDSGLLCPRWGCSLVPITRPGNSGE